MACVLGALASQEMIKVITKQYVPASNTIVFDGINGTTDVIYV